MFTTSGQHQVQSMRELIAAWGVKHDVAPIARLARVMHRTAIRYRNTKQARWVAESRNMQADASDLLDYARELRNRRSAA